MCSGQAPQSTGVALFPLSAHLVFLFSPLDLQISWHIRSVRGIRLSNKETKHILKAQTKEGHMEQAEERGVQLQFNDLEFCDQNI